MDEKISREIENLLQTNTFSFSRLNLFENCAFAWFLKYVVKIEQEDTLPLMLGKAVHKAIEMKMTGSEDKQALLEGWKEVEYYPFDLDEYQKLFSRANVMKGEAESPNVNVELHFKLPLDSSEGSPVIQGFIDVYREIFSTYSFTDWKSNRVMYEPLDTMQLPLYAWAISVIHNVSSVTGTLFFLRFFKDNVKTMTFTETHMEQARKWALELAEQINSALKRYYVLGEKLENTFPAKPNKGCANCPFANICVINYPNISKSEGVFASE